MTHLKNLFPCCVIKTNLTHLNTSSRVILLILAGLLPHAFAAGDETQPERLSLWSGRAPVGDGTFVAADAFIMLYQAENANGAAAVICPGGGYGGLVTGPEGMGIARWLNKHGVTGIVLEYRLPHGKPFVPLLDAQRALRTVRSRAATWGIDPNRIGIMGFSAGGHLAATAATHFDSGDPKAKDPIKQISCRPDFAVLVYPVITMGEKTHKGSRTNLLGPTPTAETKDLFSNELQVTDQTPPTFLAHAMDDTVVSPENSEMFYQALQAHNVPARYLELPSGGHGLNGYKGPMWDAWQADSLTWLGAQGIIPQPESSEAGQNTSVTAWPEYGTMAHGPLQVRLLPGEKGFVFTLYGVPGDLDTVRQLVGVMRDQKLVSKQACYNAVKAYFVSKSRDLLGRVISVTGHSHYEANPGAS